MAAAIPVRNIYFLLCYAWNRLKEGELVDVSSIGSSELADLFSRILITGIYHLQRRGLEQGYQLVAEEIAGIRGRVDVLKTARRFLGQHARAFCEFDDLNVNTPANQILKATVTLLADVSSLNQVNRKELLRIRRDLWQIEDRPLSREEFRRVTLHGNNRHYRFLLSICELVLLACMVDETTGEYRFRDFLRDERLMAKVFEDFVFNFYRINRPEIEVRKEQISWQATSQDDPELHFLPGMHTDISLRTADQTLIIDTKYYKETLQEHYDRYTIHSAHLFQLFAYLKNLEHKGGSDAAAEGLLLYPVVNERLRLSYDMHGHRVRICTVDLMRNWDKIDAELRSLV